MNECCENCIHCLEIDKIDYRKLKSGESIHSRPEGYICNGFSYEGVGTWMVGCDKEIEHCEMFSKATEKFLSLRQQNREWMDERLETEMGAE